MFYGLIKLSHCFLRCCSCHKQLFVQVFLFAWIKKLPTAVQTCVWEPQACPAHGCIQVLDGSVKIRYLGSNSRLFVVVILPFFLYLQSHLFSLEKLPLLSLTHSTGGKGIFIGDPGWGFFFLLDSCQHSASLSSADQCKPTHPSPPQQVSPFSRHNGPDSK